MVARRREHPVHRTPVIYSQEVAESYAGPGWDDTPLVLGVDRLSFQIDKMKNIPEWIRSEEHELVFVVEFSVKVRVSKLECLTYESFGHRFGFGRWCGF